MPSISVRGLTLLLLVLLSVSLMVAGIIQSELGFIRLEGGTL